MRAPVAVAARIRPVAPSTEYSLAVPATVQVNAPVLPQPFETVRVKVSVRKAPPPGSGGAATTAVWAETAVLEPAWLPAVTATRIVAPWSAAARVYWAVVAPAIGAQAVPGLSQRRQRPPSRTIRQACATAALRSITDR